MAAIRQHCNMLLQQGRTQELDQITQEILQRRYQQQRNLSGAGNKRKKTQ